MFIALALVEQFILTYHEQKLIDDAHTKKLHQDRKKAFLLNSSSEFKTIEPISHAHIDQEESYLFLIQFRNQLKTTLRQNVIKEIKKRRDKLSLIYKEEKLDSIEETEKENVRQSSFKKL
jgi:hypothetical protein